MNSKLVIAVITLFMFFNCSSSDDSFVDDPSDNNSNVTSLILNSSTLRIIANGSSRVNFTINAFDDNQNSVSSSDAQIYVDGSPLNTNFFTTNTNAIYEVYAELNGVRSNIVMINAREDLLPSAKDIPVVFHIVHFGESEGTAPNISSAQVSNLLQELNNGFSNLGGSTNPNAVDMNISFRLATLNEDNQNLLEPGINRINGTTYDVGSSSDVANDGVIGFNEADALFADTYWNPRLYLNLWFYEVGGVSTAISPKLYQSFSLDGIDSVEDNCVCDPDPENGLLQYNRLDTSAILSYPNILVHEVGHLFGLDHVFSSDNCQTSDYCPDTYSYLLNTNTECSDNEGLNVRDNYMDYGSSDTTFTYDQRERVHHVLENGLWLNELISSDR